MDETRRSLVRRTSDLSVQGEIDPANLSRQVRLGGELEADLHHARHRLGRGLRGRELVPRGFLVGARVGVERVALSRQPEIGPLGISRNEPPVLETTVDLAAELEEILAVDLNAFDVRSFATRCLGVDDDELCRYIAPA